jgi:hypothetical protein
MARSSTGGVHPDEVRAFVMEALRVGVMWADLVSGLLDDLPDDAFPNEESAEVLIEMLAGTIHPAADAAGAETLGRATALLGAASDRVLTDLRAAAARAAPRGGAA